MKKFQKILTFGLLAVSLFVTGCKKKSDEQKKLVIAFGMDEDLEMKVKAKEQFLKDLEESIGMKVEWFEPSSDMALRESLRAKKK